jgi:broad specificity phosphatase PhoE
MTTFYLIRHGETEANAGRVIQGQSNSLLTEKGRQQAADLAQELKSVQFAAAYSSDLSRAKDTADILIKDRDLKLVTDPGLRERNFGHYQGQPGHLLDDYFEQLYKKTDDEVFNWQFEDLESDAAVYQRFMAVMTEAAKDHPDQNVLVVTHGGLMRIFLYKNGYADNQELGLLALKNTGYVIADYAENRFKIKQVVGLQERATP